MSTPEPQPDPLLELAAAEAADNPEPVEQPAQSQPQAEPEPEADDAPWAQHGFKSPEAVFQAWQNASQKINEQGQELGQLRQLQRDMAAQQQQMHPTQQQQQQETFPDGTPIFSFEQVQEAVDNGLLTEVQANGVLAEQAARVQAIQMEERIMQRLAPIEAANMNRGAQDALDELNVALGDDVVARHADMIGRLITEDRAHYAHPQHGRRRLLEAVKSAEWDYQSGGGQAVRVTRTAGSRRPTPTSREGQAPSRTSRLGERDSTLTNRSCSRRSSRSGWSTRPASRFPGRAKTPRGLAPPPEWTRRTPAPA
jgi:hypothetical protein